MDALVAWRPFREFERMRRETERHFSRIFDGGTIKYQPTSESVAAWRGFMRVF